MLGAVAGDSASIAARLGDRAYYPVVIHCTAERDRTRIVMACLLDPLDVNGEAIATDYARSDAVVHNGGEPTPTRFSDF